MHGSRRRPWRRRPRPTSPAPSAARCRPTRRGRPLNLDFETGTLEDWTRRGRRLRRPAGRGRHGRSPAAGHEEPARGPVLGRHATSAAGDDAAGHADLGPVQGHAALSPASSSAAGRTRRPRVELVRKDTGEVDLPRLGRRRRGPEAGRRRPDAAPRQGDLHPAGRRRTRGGWGHVNFDDFRLHDAKPTFPTAADGGRPTSIAHAGLSPEEAAAAMTVPDGLHGHALRRRARRRPADRVRHRRPRPALGRRGVFLSRSACPTTRRSDRILIFEDTDGDGQFDTRKVFADKLNLVSGLEVGFGGVWVGAAPNFLFIPDTDGDDRPDGPPQVLLDGWGYQDTHETLEHVHLGPRRLALRLPRRLHALARRQARHARRRPRPDQRRHLALSPDAARLRGLRRRHEQPLGRRLRRARPGVPHRLRHPAPLSRHPGRPLRAAGRAALQPVHLRRHQDDRRPSPLRRRQPARRQRPLRRGRRRPRPRRRDDLPGRRLARGVPRLDLHEQHPRRPAQPRHPRARRARASSATTPPTSSWPTTRWSQIVNLKYGPDGQTST